MQFVLDSTVHLVKISKNLLNVDAGVFKLNRMVKTATGSRSRVHEVLSGIRLVFEANQALTKRNKHSLSSWLTEFMRQLNSKGTIGETINSG